jgi:hypothetical protein
MVPVQEESRSKFELIFFQAYAKNNAVREQDVRRHATRLGKALQKNTMHWLNPV